MTAKTAKRKGKFGLAGRVALIACGTAIAATLMQWIVTPVLLRSQFDNAQLNYAHGAAQQLAMIAGDDMRSGGGEDLEKLVERMANPLPGGGAAIIGLDGKIMAANKKGADAARGLGLKSGQLRELAVVKGDSRIAVYPITENSEPIAYAMLSMEPRTLVSTWVGILVYNALVFALALAVFFFFLFPLARRALKPVTLLEQSIRRRDPKDKSKLADSSEDRVLKPLLAAVDEVHERSEAAMRRALTLAYADPVTRLPNRLRFLSKIEALIDRQRQDAWLAVCDLDGFRKINASVGPRLADAVLAVVADRLRETTAAIEGASFFIGRIGADQFGILAPGAAKDTISAFLTLAERAIQDPVTVEGHTLRVTAAFGAACVPDDAATATDLMKQAEIALKEAKHAVGERRAFFDHRLIEKVKARQNLEKEIAEGLDRGEFVAVFQPKVKLETGELVGAEALARWRRPDGAVVSPGRFVPVCEEMGLIGKLGRVVMRDACFAAAEWNANGISARIAVNVSPQQFDEPDFIQSVYQALDDSGLDPKKLELEITESAAVADPDRVARIMWPLRNRGVRLAIDDFGTGHSNFASITRLPFDVFKIDQQFVRALATDTNAPAIVEMILAMAEALGQ